MKYIFLKCLFMLQNFVQLFFPINGSPIFCFITIKIVFSFIQNLKRFALFKMFVKFPSQKRAVNNRLLKSCTDFFCLVDGEIDDWRNMFHLNVIASTKCCQESYKCMKKYGIDDGHIININRCVYK